jgi:hypothetical protein
MTIIAGLVHDGTVYIGGDSAGLSGYMLTSRADEKVFRIGDYVIGFTSSFRMGQLLRYSLSPPIPPKSGLPRFMATKFVDAVRKCLADGGWVKKESEREDGGTFLVGVGGRLFRVENDFQVGENIDKYDAVGCAEDVALGAFAVTDGDPAKRLRRVLAAAERHSGGVRSPFKVVATRSR